MPYLCSKCLTKLCEIRHVVKRLLRGTCPLLRAFLLSWIWSCYNGSSWSVLVWLLKLPFMHESLLLDKKDQKLTRFEKHMARQNYEREVMLGGRSSTRSYSPPRSAPRSLYSPPPPPPPPFTPAPFNDRFLCCDFYSWHFCFKLWCWLPCVQRSVLQCMAECRKNQEVYALSTKKTPFTIFLVYALFTTLASMFARKMASSFVCVVCFSGLSVFKFCIFCISNLFSFLYFPVWTSENESL